MNTLYRTGPDQLQDQARWIETLLLRELHIGRVVGYLGPVPLGLPGATLSLIQAEALAHDDDAIEAARSDPDVMALSEKAQAYLERIAARVGAAAQCGVRLPFEALAATLALTRFQRDTLALACAVDSDTHLQRLCAFVNDDLTRPWVDGGLAMQLFGPLRRRSVGCHAELGPGSPLFRFGLLRPPEGPWDAVTITRLPLRPTRRLLAHLLGDETLGPPLETVAAWFERSTLDQTGAGDLVLSDAVRTAIEARAADASRPALLVIRGPAGSGRRTVAKLLSARDGRPALVVDCRAIPAEVDLEALVQAARREVVLRGASCVFAGVDGWDAGRREILWRSFDDAEVRWMVTSLGALEVPFAHETLQLEVPDFAARAELWARVLGAGVEREHLEAPAACYRLTPGQIVEAAARHHAPVPRGRAVATWIDAAVSKSVGTTLGGLADRIVHRARWDELILPEETIKQLREFANRHVHRADVMIRWGLGGSGGRDQSGISALFHGPSGTGKTMAASVVAAHLNMDLFRIDLSRVMSKWVGETEKQLSRVFDEAERSHALLLFDEADSLFAKRSEVKSTQDRYGNLSVNYLLQRMDSFSGMCVLTTNLQASIDTAFQRRLHFRIHFPAPEFEERARMWRAMLPSAAPVADDVDHDWLGETFEMSGGHIRKAVVRAGFLAAERARDIDMDLLVEAGQAEYKALGKLVRQLDYRSE